MPGSCPISTCARAVRPARDCSVWSHHRSSTGHGPAPEDRVSRNHLRALLVMLPLALAAVLMVTDTDVAYFHQEFAYIIKPISRENLIPATKSVLWNWRREEELRQRISHLENKLETRIIVDKAKGILMDVQGWTEEQAHRYIQKEAMNQGITARQMATLIVEKLGKNRALLKKEEE